MHLRGQGKLLEELVGRGNDAAGGGVAGGGEDQVDELLGELDVGELQGAADEDHDGLVRLGELIAFTRERVRLATDGDQLPTPSLAPFDASWVMAGSR